MNEEIIITILTSGSSLIVAVASIVANNRILGFKVDELRKDVEKHNQLVERVAVLERDNKTAFVRIDENREQINKLRDR